MNLDEDMNLGQEMKFINMDIIIVAMPVTANTRIVHCVQKTTFFWQVIILLPAVATPLMLRYTLLRKALSTNGVVTKWV